MSIKNVAMILCLIITGISCSKVDEILPAAGNPLPYGEKPLVTTARLLDSIPGVGIYRTVYRKSTARHYIDSARNAAGKTDMPFTLFVPKDAAWLHAGYDMAKAQSLTAAECDALILYLLVAGRILPDSVAPVSGGTMYYPVIPPGSFPVEQSGFTQYFDHLYYLNIAFADKAFFLNGVQAGTYNGITGTSDGAVYLLDTLVRCPTRTIYEILSADTSYSYYLAALEKSSALYAQYKVGLSPEDRNEELMGAAATPFNNYLPLLKTFQPNRGQVSLIRSYSYMVLAPDNNAFRKAGLGDIGAIEHFIEQSYITTDSYREIDHAIPRYTNMDSALVYSFVTREWATDGNPGLAFYFTQTSTDFASYLFYTSDLKPDNRVVQEGILARATIDFYDWTTFDENTWEFTPNLTTSDMKWLFGAEGGRSSVRRGDLPGGPVAYIAPEHSNITALNGVIHRIDKLLLPHP